MSVASYIEHTNLSPVLTIGDIDRIVAEASEFKFFGVCVPPFWVRRARREIGREKAEREKNKNRMLRDFLITNF